MTTPEQPDMVEAAFVPGVFRCAKCGFQLIQSNLNATDGMITARDAPGDKCPNDGSPMWRVSWREYAMEQIEGYDRLISEKDAQIAALQPTPKAREDGELRELLRKLADAADEVNGAIDAQTYDEKKRMIDWPDGCEFDVVITAKQERDMNAAICAAQTYLKRTASPPSNTRIDATLGESA